MLLFGCCSLVVLRIALAGGGRVGDAVLAGALWIVLVFAALVGTARAWSAEREDGAYDALLVAPAARTAIHAGKVLAAVVTTLVLDAVLVLLYLGLFGAPSSIGDVLLLAASVALAAIGFAAVGVLVPLLFRRAHPDLRGRDASPLPDTEPVPVSPS